jgi:hypothetical protein
MALGESPAVASSPRRDTRAGLKSPVDRPRRDSTGSPSAIFGERRMYGGRIALGKR